MADINTNLQIAFTLPRHNTWYGKRPSTELVEAWMEKNGHRFTMGQLEDFVKTFGTKTKRGVEFDDARARHKNAKSRKFVQGIIDHIYNGTQA